MYPSDWHLTYGDKTYLSAKTILPSLIELFGIKSTIEVGCGNAHWTRAAVEAGVADYLVFDGPWNDQRDLLVDSAYFLEGNLDDAIPLKRRYDAAICLEVAEHVAKSSADTVVRSLTSASDIVIFGAAIPMQGGYGHINEQWPSWWKNKFEAYGYEAFDIVRPLHWTNQNIHYWYRQNMFIYISNQCQDILEIARDKISKIDFKPMMDVAHPEKYTEIASYDAIAFKRLALRFPSWLVKRARAKFGL